MSNFIERNHLHTPLIVLRKFFIYLALITTVLACSKDSDDINMEMVSNPEEGTSIPEEELTEEVSSEIQLAFNWTGQMQHPNGLMESAEGTDFVSLYDNALSALAFMAMGDFQKAEGIFDYFNERIDTELNDGVGGFYQFRNTEGGEKRVIWLGDNAWLLIALNKYYELTGNTRYLGLAEETERWIRSLQDTDGGLWGGYNEDGSRIHKITEGILVAFEAVNGYDEFHEGILEFLKNNRWNVADELLVAWPENESYYYALDLHSLGYMILEKFPLTTLEKATRYKTTKEVTATGNTVTGYCFDEDKDVIWLEGTAQMALAFKRSGQLLQADTLLEDLGKTLIPSQRWPSSSGIPYASNQGSTYGATPLWEHADHKPALSSTIWYLFGKLNFNPFTGEQPKSIPAKDRFWVPIM